MRNPFRRKPKASPHVDPFRQLLRRRRKYADVAWGSTTYDGDEDQGRKTGDLEETELVCSIDRWGTSHAVLLDIDYPAYLKPSSTPGHFHLYLDVPGGIPHNDYMTLLSILGRYGVVEEGYAEASIQRGYSALRPPWCKKDLDSLVGPYA